MWKLKKYSHTDTKSMEQLEHNPKMNIKKYEKKTHLFIYLKIITFLVLDNTNTTHKTTKVKEKWKGMQNIFVSHSKWSNIKTTAINY